MLQFILGEKGSGKTEYFIKDAATKGGVSILIVPEQISHSAEMQVLQKTGVFGLGSMEVLSFGQMAARMVKLSDNAATKHIDNAGKVMILYRILRDGDYTLLSGDEEEKAVCVMKLISEFKRYCVTVEDIENATEKTNDTALSKKLAEIASVYRKFEECIKGNFINSDDNLERLALSDYAKEKYRGVNIYIDGFSRFTKAEIMCIEMFLQNAENVFVSVCMDADMKDFIHFKTCVQTMSQIKKSAEKLGVKTGDDIVLNKAEDTKEDLSFLSKAYFMPKCIPYEKNPENMEIFMGKNLISEIEYAAANIRSLVKEKGYFYRDFAVLCSDISLYGEYIETIFEKYGIKVFPDSKTNVTNHPVASFIISVLEIICKGYTYRSMFRCIKYKFLNITDEQCDVLENFAIESGAAGSMWSECEKWEKYVDEFLGKRYDESEAVNKRAKICKEAGCAVIKPIAKLKGDLSGERSVKGKCKALYNFLQAIDVNGTLLRAASYFESISDSYSAIEYKSVYNKIMDVLDEMCDAMGDDKISNESFKEVLKTGIGQFEIGKIPAVKDGVICGDVQVANELDVPVLFVLGMNDTVFPPGINKTGFLNDGDRQQLEEMNIKMAAECKSAAIENEYLLYKILTAPTDKIFFCYSMANLEGSGLRPAWAVRKIEDVMPRIKTTDDILVPNPHMELSAPVQAFEKTVLSLSGSERESAEYKTAYKWFSEHKEWSERLKNAEKTLSAKNSAVPLEKEETDILYGDEMITAVSRLEKFASCPFSHYMRYVLGAQPRKEYKFQPKDAGVFLHAIMERFSVRVDESGKRWTDIDDNYIKNAVRDILLEDESIRNSISIDGAVGERAFIRLCKAAESAVKLMVEHIKRGKFRPMGYEVRFSENGKIKPLTIELPYGKKVRITGVIDRIDALETEKGTYFRIIDYKTGNKDLDLTELYNGISLQLAVYTCVAEESVGKPAGMLYFRLADKNIEAEPFLGEDAIIEKRKKEAKLSGVVVATDEVLDSMDVEGKFDFLPVGRKKNGEISGKYFTEENFKMLSSFVKKKVASIAGEIFAGKNDILPCKSGENVACDRCEYADACRFDRALGCREKEIQKLSREEIWEKIGEEYEC